MPIVRVQSDLQVLRDGLEGTLNQRPFFRQVSGVDTNLRQTPSGLRFFCGCQRLNMQRTIYTLRKVVWMGLGNGFYTERVFKNGRGQVRLPFSGFMESVRYSLPPANWSVD